MQRTLEKLACEKNTFLEYGQNHMQTLSSMGASENLVQSYIKTRERIEQSLSLGEIDHTSLKHHKDSVGLTFEYYSEAANRSTAQVLRYKTYVLSHNSPTSKGVFFVEDKFTERIICAGQI